MEHRSDCAIHNGPAMPAVQCDCGADALKRQTVDAAKALVTEWLPSNLKEWHSDCRQAIREAEERDFVGSYCDGVERMSIYRQGEWVDLTEVEMLEARLSGLADQMQRWLNAARKMIGAPKRT